MKKASKQTYSEAYNELKEILVQIENASISIDDLSEKVKRASELIKLCEAKLSKTESEVMEILNEMENANYKKIDYDMLDNEFGINEDDPDVSIF